MDFTQVMNTFLNIPGVVRVHNLRIWALSMDKTAISAHLAICKCMLVTDRPSVNHLFSFLKIPVSDFKIKCVISLKDFT